MEAVGLETNKRREGQRKLGRKRYRFLVVSLTWIEQWYTLPGLRENPFLASPPSPGSTSVVERESWPPTRRSPSSSTALVGPHLVWRVSW